MNYDDFVNTKISMFVPSGLQPVDFDYPLMPHQDALAQWALRRGKAAIFADTGLGKTRMQLAWADQVCKVAGLPVLILAPLAVAAQTVAEGADIGVKVTQIFHGDQSTVGIDICNYDRLHLIDASKYGAVVLDESSIIKHHNTKTLQHLLDAFKATPYKLCATATPAPNDWTELGTHAEFLGVCSRVEMLSEYFCHDGAETQVWRLKGHAKNAFWRWVSSWGAMLRRPSDLGFDNNAYDLPALNIHEHTVHAEHSTNGMLFAMEAQTLSERRDARRSSVNERVKDCAAMVNSQNEPWIVWCELNTESEMLTKAISGAVEVTGSDSIEYKEIAARWFAGEICVCKNKMFSAKLSEWKRKEQATTKNSITLKIEKEEFRSLLRTKSNTQMIAKNITQTTTPPTKSESLNSLKSIETEQKLSETLPENRLMLPTRNALSERLKSGNLPTQENDLTSACASTGLPQTVTTQCSPSNPASVPFANHRMLEIGAEADSTLTIATQQESLEVYCADTATSESASLETAPMFLTVPRCICGHQSGVRRLVSKSSIFGFGLNWQHCRKMAFVGVTDSFESYYQAVRRCWRFGQSRAVDVHIFSSALEGAVAANLKRKERDALEMAEQLAKETRESVKASVLGLTRTFNVYEPELKIQTPAWLMEAA